MENKVLHAIGDLAATDVHSLNHNDMLINAKIYIDRLLCPNKDVVGW